MILLSRIRCWNKKKSGSLGMSLDGMPCASGLPPSMTWSGRGISNLAKGQHERLSGPLAWPAYSVIGSLTSKPFVQLEESIDALSI